MKNDLTVGDPLKKIIWFALPALVSYVIRQLFAVSDTMVVGRLLGANALAAMSSAGVVAAMLIGISSGIAQGFGVKLGIAFGAKDYKLLRHYLMMSLILGFLVALLIGGAGVVLSKPLFILMDMPDELIRIATPYITITFLELPISLICTIAGTVLRSIGDNKASVSLGIVSMFLGVMCDIFFVRVLGCGAEGTAYGTLVTNLIIGTVTFVYMFKKYEMLRLTKEDIYFDWRSCRDMLANGIPMGLNYSINYIGGVFLQSTVNGLGTTVVAAYAAGTRLEPLATAPMSILGSTMAVYCSQNLGAKKFDRIFEGIRKGLVLAVVLTVLGMTFTLGLSEAVVHLFIKDPSAELVFYAARYARTLACFYPALVVIYFFRSCLQGLEQQFVPTISAAVEMVCRIGTVVLFQDVIGFWSVCFAPPSAWVACAILMIVAYFQWRYKTKKKLAEMV